MRSCAASSGGRRNVLSGTTVAPARLAPNATTGHAVPLVMSTPTRRALAHPEVGEVRGERGTATLELAVRQRVVVGDDEVAVGLLVGPATDQPRHGEALAAHAKSSSIACRSGLPLDSIGRSAGASTRKRRGTLYADSRVAQLGAERVEIGRGVGFGQDHRRHHLVALGVGDAEHHHRETTGRVAQRRLDLERRHVRTRGLDHRAASAVEVEEAVLVDVEEVAGAVPAVGREDLEALAPVVALHERAARGTTARRWCRPARRRASRDRPRVA